MFGSLPTNKTFLSLLALTAISNSLIVDASHAQTSQAKTSTKLEITRVVRGLAALRQTVDGLSKQVANFKPTVMTAPVASPTPAAPPATAVPVQAPIGKNQSTSSWVSFDFYTGRAGEVVSYHNASGIGVAFRIREGGKNVQEYKLDFPFAERTADQKIADSFMIQNCIGEFRRVSGIDGATFYIFASSDPKLGLLCSSSM
jgi:hypothetical protein